MRGLRCSVDTSKGLQFALLWVTTCIHLHAFAMDHENGVHISKDKFFRTGVKLMRKERRAQQAWQAERQDVATVVEREEDENNDVGLLEGKVKREELKQKLFTYLDSIE